MAIQTSGNYDTEAKIVINTDADNGLDYYDASKKFGFNDDAVEPYFLVDGVNVAINSISSLPYECEMNIRSGKPSTEIQLMFHNIPDNIQLYLIDGVQEIKIENDIPYPATVGKGDNERRFKLRIASGKV
ncbi:MAG: hypothetical protein LBH32_05600 [Dysgonamonadaceae bacterium]|nr:hypothetical protein [Dysgonamonadaceae bacterium]